MTVDATSWDRDRDHFVRAQRDSGWQGESETELDEAGPLAREFAEFTRRLLSATTLAEVLGRTVSAAHTVIPAVQLASVTLRETGGRFHTPAHTGEVAVELDHEQYRAERGPCADAARPDGPAMARSSDLTREERWPEFAAAAARAGYRSVLATSILPAAGSEFPAGALNLYSHQSEAFVPADADRALLLAGHASLALATTNAVSAADVERHQLRRAIDSRDLIGQAKGILMARRGLTADRAFDVLRRTSQELNVKLVDLARTVTDSPTALDI